MNARVCGLLLLAAARTPAADAPPVAAPAPPPGLLAATLAPGSVPLGGVVDGFCFAPDESYLAARVGDRVVLIDPAANKVLKTITLPELKSKEKTAPGFNGLNFSSLEDALAASADGKTLVLRDCDNNLFRVLDAAAGKHVHDAPLKLLETELNSQLFGGGIKPTFASSPPFAVSPDGRYVAQSATPACFKVYDVPNKKYLDTAWKGHDAPPTALAFAADGKALFTAGSDGVAFEWALDKAEPIRAFEGHRGGVVAVVPSPDGSKLATASQVDRTVRVWDRKTGKHLHRLPIAKSPDDADSSVVGIYSRIYGVDMAPPGRCAAWAGAPTGRPSCCWPRPRPGRRGSASTPPPASPSTRPTGPAPRPRPCPPARTPAAPASTHSARPPGRRPSRRRPPSTWPCRWRPSRSWSASSKTPARSSSTP